MSCRLHSVSSRSNLSVTLRKAAYLGHYKPATRQICPIHTLTLTQTHSLYYYLYETFPWTYTFPLAGLPAGNRGSCPRLPCLSHSSSGAPIRATMNSKPALKSIKSAKGVNFSRDISPVFSPNLYF